MQIICGFPGVGKSELGKLYPTKKFADMEPTPYRNAANWPRNYIEPLEFVIKIEHYDAVLVATYPEVIRWLLDQGKQLILVYPDEAQKEEYRSRYTRRGNSVKGVQVLMGMFDSNIRNLRAISHPNCTHVVLLPGQYLNDVIAL